MNKKKIYLLLIWVCSCYTWQLYAQTGELTGIVLGVADAPLVAATVTDMGAGRTTLTDSLGRFSLIVPADQAVRVRVAFVGYRPRTEVFRVPAGRRERVRIKLEEQIQTTEEIEVAGQETAFDVRQEAGTLILDPNQLRYVPTAFGDFNQQLLSVGLGIQSNDELSSAYNVRGGNYDENLVYVNGMEVYRPFLVQAGQQEGLSFINPQLVEAVSFSSGGWQAKYGDKLSSVLDVTYKDPTQWAASAEASLLGASAHVEGATQDKKLRFLTGLRYKDGRYLFNTLEVNGSYFPRFVDWQGYVSFRPDSLTQISLLTSIASNRYQLIPENRITTFGTFNEQLRFLVSYTGEEQLNYDTYQAGLQVRRRLSDRWTSRVIFSAMQTYEREYRNLLGSYRLCDVDTDLNSSTFNQCALVRGQAAQFEYGRNLLSANITSIAWRNEYLLTDNTIAEFGARFQYEGIQDRLYEYSFLDSADFITLEPLLDAQIDLNSNRWMGYAQMTHYRKSEAAESRLHYGIRFNYWSLNQQLLWSPRLQYAITPNWQRKITFNFAAGLYHQPPFYRELRSFAGELNRRLRAQTALHLIAGMDWNFTLSGRPFKFISEVYHKQIWHLIPYDMDNLRLRYYANNDARGRVTGLDARLSGEFIRGTESWFGISTLVAREDVDFDERGFIRRPTDQRVTATLFFQDHLPNDPTLRMYIRLLYGSGLPFGFPNRPQSRAILRGAQYRRVDVGFSKSLIFEEQKGLRSLWISIEVLNLLGVENVIAYSWVRDFVNDRQYAIPNSLSQRFFNLKVVGHF